MAHHRGKHVRITPRRRLRSLAPAATALAIGVAVTGAAAVPALAHGPDDGGGYHDDGGGWDGDHAGGGEDWERDGGDHWDGDRWDGDRDGDHWGGDEDSAPTVPPPAPEPAPPDPMPTPPSPAPKPAPPAPEPAEPAPVAPEPEADPPAAESAPEPTPAIVAAVAPLEADAMNAAGRVPASTSRSGDETDAAAGIATGVALAAAAGFGAVLVRSRRVA